MQGRIDEAGRHEMPISINFRVEAVLRFLSYHTRLYSLSLIAWSIRGVLKFRDVKFAVIIGYVCAFFQYDMITRCKDK